MGANKGPRQFEQEIDISECVEFNYNSTLYDRLEKEGCLQDFLETIKACVADGMTLKEIAKELTISFGFFTSGKSKSDGSHTEGAIHPDTLTRMRGRYPDIRKAFTFKPETQLSKLRNKLLQNAIEKSSMFDEESLKVLEKLDRAGRYVYREPKVQQVVNKQTIESNTIVSSATQDTINNMMESIKALAELKLKAAEAEIDESFK